VACVGVAGSESSDVGHFPDDHGGAECRAATDVEQGGGPLGDKVVQLFVELEDLICQQAATLDQATGQWCLLVVEVGEDCCQVLGETRSSQ
jgi:hypothetical protein